MVNLRLTVYIKQLKTLWYISLCYTVGIRAGFVYNCVCVELLTVTVDVRMFVRNELVRRNGNWTECKETRIFVHVLC
jgi:hypothetical protein